MSQNIHIAAPQHTINGIKLTKMAKFFFAALAILRQTLKSEKDIHMSQDNAAQQTTITPPDGTSVVNLNHPPASEQNSAVVIQIEPENPQPNDAPSISKNSLYSQKIAFFRNATLSVSFQLNLNTLAAQSGIFNFSDLEIDMGTSFKVGAKTGGRITPLKLGHSDYMASERVKFAARLAKTPVTTLAKAFRTHPNYRPNTKTESLDTDLEYVPYVHSPSAKLLPPETTNHINILQQLGWIHTIFSCANSIKALGPSAFTLDFTKKILSTDIKIARKAHQTAEVTEAIEENQKAIEKLETNLQASNYSWPEGVLQTVAKHATFRHPEKYPGLYHNYRRLEDQLFESSRPAR